MMLMMTLMTTMSSHMMRKKKKRQIKDSEVEEVEPVVVEEADKDINSMMMRKMKVTEEDMARPTNSRQKTSQIPFQQRSPLVEDTIKRKTLKLMRKIILISECFNSS